MIQERDAPNVSSTKAAPSLAGANSHGTLAAKSVFHSLVEKRAMGAELSPRVERRIQQLTDVGERIFFLLLFTIFALNLAPTLLAFPANALVLISEGLIVFFTIVRRDARMVTTRPVDWLAALSGAALPLFAKAGGHGWRAFWRDYHDGGFGNQHLRKVDLAPQLRFDGSKSRPGSFRTLSDCPTSHICWLYSGLRWVSSQQSADLEFRAIYRDDQSFVSAHPCRGNAASA